MSPSSGVGGGCRGRVTAARRRWPAAFWSATCCEGVAQVAQRRGEQAGERADRRLHPAGQLGQQDLARRQGGEPRHVVGADRLVAEDGAGDPDDRAVRSGGVEDRLGGAGLVVPERDRGRADRAAGSAPRRPNRSAAIRISRFLTTR